MERVLVVPTDVVLAELGLGVGQPDVGGQAGFFPGKDAACLELVRSRGYFEERPRAEQDPTIKQIIPYGMVVFEDQVFLLRRTKRGGEARLHEKVSLGVGGHINPADVAGDDLQSAVLRGFERELHEELDLSAPYRLRRMGVLNDDSNSVGKVHLGVVFLVELSAPHIRVREVDQLAGELVPAASLGMHRARLETWSALLQDHFWPAVSSS